MSLNVYEFNGSFPLPEGDVAPSRVDSVKILTPQEAGIEKADYIRALLLGTELTHQERSVAYFVVGNPFHDEMHRHFCERLSITPDANPQKFEMIISDTNNPFLIRNIHSDESSAPYGIEYCVQNQRINPQNN